MRECSISHLSGEISDFRVSLVLQHFFYLVELATLNCSSRVDAMILLFSQLKELSELLACPPGVLLLGEFCALVRMTLGHVAAQCLCLFEEFVFAEGASEDLAGGVCRKLFLWIQSSWGWICVIPRIFGLRSCTTWRFFLHGRECRRNRPRSLLPNDDWGSHNIHLTGISHIRQARSFTTSNLDRRCEAGPGRDDINLLVLLMQVRCVAVGSITVLEFLLLDDWTED